jgi:hypothetical protein
MRHPFDGILRPETGQLEVAAESRQTAASSVAATEESRRDALKQFIAGGAVVFGLADSPLLGDDAKGRGDTKRTAARGYGRHLVVPADFRALKSERRAELGVGGGYFRRAMKKNEQFPKAGFLAWLTPDAAKTLATRMGVREVLPIKAEDVPGPGTRPAGASQLAVRLVPNGFTKARPPKGSFVDAPDLIEQWSKRFPDVKFKPGGSAETVLVNIGPAGMPESLPAALKKHPQVVGLHWQGTVTTQAIGEEGATTKAVGEEGASTRRRGEEGGVSTRRLGEEGGRPPLTRARREAGNVSRGTLTTQALGEEGAKGR